MERGCTCVEESVSIPAPCGSLLPRARAVSERKTVPTRPAARLACAVESAPVARVRETFVASPYAPFDECMRRLDECDT